MKGLILMTALLLCSGIILPQSKGKNTFLYAGITHSLDETATRTGFVFGSIINEAVGFSLGYSSFNGETSYYGTSLKGSSISIGASANLITIGDSNPSNFSVLGNYSLMSIDPFTYQKKPMTAEATNQYIGFQFTKTFNTGSPTFELYGSIVVMDADINYRYSNKTFQTFNRGDAMFTGGVSLIPFDNTAYPLVLTMQISQSKNITSVFVGASLRLKMKLKNKEQ